MGTHHSSGIPLSLLFFSSILPETFFPAQSINSPHEKQMAKRPTRKKPEGENTTSLTDRILTGEDGTPVNVKVDVIPKTSETVIAHNMKYLSDFDTLDFWMPLAILLLIFLLQFLWGAGIIIILLQVALVFDLRKRVTRRPSGRATVGLVQPYANFGWGKAFLTYLVALPVIIGSIVLNQKFSRLLFPKHYAEQDRIKMEMEQQRQQQQQWLEKFEKQLENMEDFEGFDFEDFGDMDYEQFEGMPGNFEGVTEPYQGLNLEQLQNFNLESLGNNTGSAILAGLLALGLLALLIMFLQVVVFAPIVEELWFRGIGLAGFLRKPLSPTAAAIWTSVVFGACHGPDRFIFTTVFGLVLCFIRFRSGSLYCCMAIHALHNLSVVVIEFVLLARMLMQ